MNRSSEDELVRAAIAGSKTAYGCLYDRFAPLVRAVCYDETQNLADAQDLAQEVFLRAYRGLGGLRKPESFGPWIIGIARRRCCEWHRQARRERRHRQVSAQAISDHREQNGELTKLGEHMAQLPERERLALHAFYLCGQSADEARATLGLSRSGFYRALGRARNRLRKRLRRHEESIR